MRTEEGLLLLNDEGKVLWANTVAGELLGCSRNELAGLALPLVGEPTGPAQSVSTQRILPPPSGVSHAAGLKAPGKTAPGGSPAAGNPSPPVPPVGPVASAFRSLLAGKIMEAEGNARIPDRDEKRVAVHWRLWSLPAAEEKRRILLSISETAQASADGPITSSYKDIFEHAVEGIFRSTPEGRLLEVNPAMARMCGYESPAEMVDRVQDLNSDWYLRPNRRDEFLLTMQQHGSVAGFESEVFRPDGSVFWIAEFARVVRSREGVSLYFEGSVIDISKRKQAESALRLSEERFRSLVETTRVIPFEFHVATQCFVYLGPQAEAVFGRSLGSRLTFERWVSLLDPNDVREGTRFADLPGSEPQSDYQTEFRVRTPINNQEIWIKQIVHFDCADAEIGRVVRGFFFEITEAKKLEAETERSRIQLRELVARLEQIREDERTSIAGDIHDELGQALTLLNIDLSWMMERLGNSWTMDSRPTLIERMSEMERKVEGAIQTVHRMLRSLKPPLLEDAGLKEAIEYHLVEMAKRFGFRSQFEGTDVPPLSEEWKTAIYRIFQEIIANACRHSKASRVKVCLSASSDHIFMTVEDNGCGISEANLLDPTRFGILGIKEKALALGGKVDVHGVSGKGTTVALRVPVEQAAVSEKGVATIPTMPPLSGPPTSLTQLGQLFG